MEIFSFLRIDFKLFGIRNIVFPLDPVGNLGSETDYQLELLKHLLFLNL